MVSGHDFVGGLKEGQENSGLADSLARFVTSLRLNAASHPPAGVLTYVRPPKEALDKLQSTCSAEVAGRVRIVSVHDPGSRKHVPVNTWVGVGREIGPTGEVCGAGMKITRV